MQERQEQEESKQRQTKDNPALSGALSELTAREMYQQRESEIES